MQHDTSILRRQQMTIVNTPADLASAPASDEHLAFLNGLLNDYVILTTQRTPMATTALLSMAMMGTSSL